MVEQEFSNYKEPELPGVPPPSDREIKLTLVGRAVFQFQSYLLNNRLEKHFATHDYLNGLANEKKEALIRMNTALGRTLVLAFILACYVSGIWLDVEFMNFKVLQFPATIETVSLLTAFLLLATVLMFLDFIIIDRILGVLSGSILKIDSPIYGYAHKNSMGIWADIFTIRHAGYQSSLAHRSVVIFFLGYIFLYGLTLLSFSFGSVAYAFYFVVIEEHTTTWMFSMMMWVALVVGLMALFIFVVAILIRFKFAIPLDVYIAMEQERAGQAAVARDATDLGQS